MRNNIKYKNLYRWGILCISVCFILIFPLYSLGVENKYLPLIIMMAFSPLVIILERYKPDKNLIYLMAVLLLMFLGGKVKHPETFRMNSFVYTIAFFSLFLSFDTVLQKRAIPVIRFGKFLKFLIYAYAIVLFIQQLEVLVGVSEPINLTFFGGRDENPYKLNSLAIEPSNLGMIMPCVMYCYMKVQELLRNETKYNPKHILHDDLKVWLLFLYATLGCGSMTSFFSVAVLALYFVNNRNIRYIPIIAFLLIGIIYGLMKISPKMNDRIQNLFNTSFTSADMIVDTDASSSVRIVPYILYFKSFDVDSETFFGHGMDALENEANANILTKERLLNDERVGADSLINTFYDYGLICGFLFLIFILRNITPKFKSFETLFYFLVYLMLPMNHFVLWGVIFSMMTIKQYTILNSKTKRVIINER